MQKWYGFPMLATAGLAFIAFLIGILASKPLRNSPGAQLALAWLLAQGRDIIPIPGTRRESLLRENIAALEIELSRDEVAELGSLGPQAQVAGTRYDEAGMKRVGL